MDKLEVDDNDEKTVPGVVAEVVMVVVYSTLWYVHVGNHSASPGCVVIT